MLGLTLRDEFRTDQMRDTAITFHRDDGSGALDIAPQLFFEITYPSLDLQKALEAISQKSAGRPVVLLGERGRGKSHIMAAQHHAITAPDTVEAWAHEWGDRLGEIGGKRVVLSDTFPTALSRTHHAPFNAVGSPVTSNF